MSTVVGSQSAGRLAAAGLLALGLLGCASGHERVMPRPRTTSTLEVDPELAEAPPELSSSTTLIASPKGVLLPVLARDGDRFRVSTPCGAQVVVAGKPVDAVDVVLDPGHGGGETGAVGPNGLQEKDLNATVAGFARNALAHEGVRVIPTRNGDYRMTLIARALLSSAAKPKAFVSIHHNSGSDMPSATPGTDVYYQVASPESKRLGGLIYEEVTKMLGSLKGVTWVAGKYPGVQVRLNDQGADYFGVVRRTAGTPGVLVEMGYISNTSEATVYAERNVQRAEGEAVARGIVRFLRTRDQGTGFITTPDPKQGALGGGGGGANGCVDPSL